MTDEDQINAKVAALIEIIEAIPKAEYRIDIQVRHAKTKKYIAGAEESNNWNASWC